MPEQNLPTQYPGSTVSGLPQVNPLNFNLTNPVPVAPAVPVETQPKTTSVVTDKLATQDVSKIQQGTTNLQNQINTQAVAKANMPVTQPDATSGLSFSAKAAKAAQYGMQNYTGTKEQDQMLLQKMMDEKASLEAQMKNQPKGSGYLTEGSGTATPQVITPQQKALNDYQAAQQKIADDNDAMFKDMQTTLDKYKAGTLPLTPEQDAQIEQAKATFERLRQQQIIANKNYEGAVTNAGIVSGRQRYAREIEMGNVAASVNTGIQKLSDLDAKAVETIASLKSAFQEGNFKKLQTVWEAMGKIQETKAKTIKDTFDAVSSFEKDQRDFDYKVAQDNITNILNSDKFNYQQKQDAIANELNSAKFTEEKRQALVREAQDAQKIALQKQANDIAANAALGVQTLPSGKADPVAQDKYLAQFSPDVAQTIKDIANYRIDPSMASKRAGGMTPLQWARLAAGFDPSYNTMNYAARAKFNQNWTSGDLMSNRIAINTVTKHIDELAKAQEKLAQVNLNSGWLWTKKYNTLAQLLEAEKQNPAVTAYNNALNAVSSEMAKVYKGGKAAPTEQEIREQRDAIVSNLSPEAGQEAIASAIRLMTGRLSTVRDEYTATMGKPPEDLINETTRKVLEDLEARGYDVNVNELDPSPLEDVGDDYFLNFGETTGAVSGVGGDSFDWNQF
jgi:hypothetical protein